MSPADKPTPSGAFTAAMTGLRADLDAALARFTATMQAGVATPEDGDGEQVDDDAFAALCAHCTDLTRSAGMVEAHVQRVVKHLMTARIEAGMMPACPCWDCVDRHAAKPVDAPPVLDPRWN